MKKAVVVVAAFLAVLLVVGLAGMPFAEKYFARQIKDSLAQGGIGAERVAVSLFARSVALDKVTSANGDVKVGSWKVEGLAWPFDELRQGRLPFTGIGWGMPLKATRIHLEDVSVSDPDEDGSWTIKEVTAEEIDLPRYDPTYEGSFPGEVLTARLLRALSAKRVEQTEFIRTTLEETLLSVRKVVISDYAQGLIGKLEAEDIKAGGRRQQGPELTVSDLRGSGIDLRRALDLTSSADWEPGAPVGRIPVASGQVSGFGGSLMTQYGLSLDRISTETVSESRDISRSRLRVEGFVLAPSTRSIEAMATRAVLQAMNLEAVRVDFDCSGVDDRGRHEVRVEDCRLKAPDLADLSFTATFVDTDEEFWDAIDFGDIDALLGSKAALAAARLVVGDKGLLLRSLQAKSKLGGKSPAEERADLAGEIRRHQPHDVLITQDMTKLLDTVARFVEQGGTLTLDAAPQPALGLDKLEYLGRPGADLVNALGLTATLSR
ncbi:MAG: hypothetical protein BGN99_16710 [Alphaproteobacteria bacterium 65-37]|nr:hypothetical protein [Alphaproteobacteria bacterium]OJU33220.1 MAG: hypothetical protein BGN99_16710 [Alphaproteobacteria bacterium 65-37]